MAKALTKSQIVASVAETVGLTKKQTGEVLEAIVALAYKNAKNSFTLPGLGRLVYQAISQRDLIVVQSVVVLLAVVVVMVNFLVDVAYALIDPRPRVET